MSSQLADGFEITPHTNSIGADVSTINLTSLDDGQFAALQHAFEMHRLLVFRNQSLTVEEQVAFSRRFGALEVFPDPKDQADGFDTVLRVSNIQKANGEIKPIDDPGHKSFTLGTSSWHIDSSFRTYPSRASLLYGIEIPDDGGGDTMFADTALAYEALPEAERDALAGLSIIHDFEETRRRHNLPPRPPEVQVATPPAAHPLVVERPNGKHALFIGSHAAGIEGMSYEEARRLIDRLEAAATQPEFTYRHKWTPGDLILFDNISVMHQAMPYDLAGSHRLLHRTTIAGDRSLKGIDQEK